MKKHGYLRLFVVRYVIGAFVVLMVGVPVGACKKKNDTIQGNSSGVFIGDTFSLRYKECKKVIDTTVKQTNAKFPEYQICLDTIIDERPKLSHCSFTDCFSCYVYVYFRWGYVNSSNHHLMDKILGCDHLNDLCYRDNYLEKYLDTLGYRFGVCSVLPHPDIGLTISIHDYVVKMKIDKP